MMWWRKLLRIAEKTPLGNFIERKLEIVSETDPQRISVEKVSAFFGLPIRMAQGLCEMAVNEGGFRRVVEVRCPNQNCRRVLGTFQSLEDVPDTMNCSVCQLDAEQGEFRKEELDINTVYQVNDQPAVA